ncbi:hypothetical protein SAMN05444169_8618 [Bradyrhizobium erythrophlei]|jgi:hypothetical protein|uniref:Uncharacterized protein n=1 Tax=Bradyrhizobium erythrophlei TaxID=1437360 RepID=A0A1M5US46_9BRAD|nr:hypothetical protein SAMN05444169_8618 [Bradyrhizobium erythrophlei]
MPPELRIVIVNGATAPKVIGPEPSPAPAARPTRTIDHDAAVAEQTTKERYRPVSTPSGLI